MKDSIVSVRINAELKEYVNKIIREVGLTPSQVVNMFYEQIKENGELPFQIKTSK